MPTVTNNYGFMHRFLKITESHPDSIAINDIDNDKILSYKELKQLAEKRQNALTAAGIKKGNKVALILPNGIDFISYYLALISKKALPVIINNSLTSCEINQILNTIKLDYIITDEEFYKDKLGAITEPFHRVLLCGNNTLNNNEENHYNLDDLVKKTTNNHQETLKAPEGNPIISLQFTWRGLGRPLAVAHHYLDMTYSTDGLHKNFHTQGIGSVHLVTLPLYAIFGLSVMLVFPLSVGATLLITNTILKRDLADVLSTYQVTFACLVPDVIRYFNTRLAKRKQAPTELHPQLMIYSGGGHLPANDGERLSSLLGCAPVLQGYGLTETLPIIVQNKLGEQHRGAMGQIISGVEARVINADGKEVEKGHIGELIVKAPMISKGYYEDEEGTLLFFKDEWFHTGDLVWSDDNDHLYFVCQRLRISKVRAQMIDFRDIEIAALRHNSVQDARAWVVPDPKQANTIFLSVKVTDESLTEPKLLSFMGNYLSNFKLPRQIQLLNVSK